MCCHQTFGCPCLIRQLPGGDDACHVDDLRVHLDVEDGDGDLHRTRDDGLRVYGLHYRLYPIQGLIGIGLVGEDESHHRRHLVDTEELGIVYVNSPEGRQPGRYSC